MPHIISKEDFEKVQAKMKERQHKAAKFSAKQEYLLRGKIFCGECGSPYAGNSRRLRPGHPLYVSYKCTRRNQREKSCKNPEINRDKLEKIVLERLSSTLFHPSMIPSLVSSYNAYIDSHNTGVKDRIFALRRELQDIERKVKNTVNVMVETGSSALKDKLLELEETKEKLTFELTETEASMAKVQFSEDEIKRLFQNAKQQLRNGTLANRRAVIDQYVQKVLIFPERIEIHIIAFPNYVIQETVKEKMDDHL